MQYEYGRPVTLGPQTIRLHPAPHCKTPILSYTLKVTPENHLLKWQFDLYQNQLAKALFPSGTDRLIVEVDLVADLAPINSFDFVLEPEVAEYPISYSPELQREIEPYC